MLVKATLVNACGVALLCAAGWFGYIDAALDADSTYMVELIGAMFLLGLFWALRVMYFFKARYGEHEKIKIEMAAEIAPLRYIAHLLVLLGLIGTIIGFIIALSGVDPASATDLASVSPMVATLISGMSTALYTTLTGAILNIWLMLNHNILVNAYRRDLVQHGQF